MVLTATEKRDEQNKELTIIDADFFTASVNKEGYRKKCIRLDEDSYIIVYTGRRGGGKTTEMTHEGIKANCLYGMKLVSNYPIEYLLRRHKPDGSPVLEHIKSEDLDFEKLILMDEEYKGVIILIDEAPDIISHMASQGWRNRLTNAMVRQLRKNRNSLMMGAQDFELIDKSIRWQVDIEVQCKDASRFIDDPTLLRGSLLWTNWFDHSGVWTNHTTQERINKGIDPCVMRKKVRPCLLWGNDTHLPVFDSWRPIDIMESLRKVEIKMSTIQIGDKVNQTMADQYPVSGGVLIKALNTIKTMFHEDKDNLAMYQRELYQSCSPITSAEKNNLGRMLSEYGIDRGGDGAKRYYSFDRFNMEGFTNYVMSRQGNND
jgi:hypothetical protein